ncbi:MAG: YeeE/YedE family protein [Rhodoblastus sp.]|nr:YeeE/YedE family protein [Rhodoblastus sp.]
MSLAAPALTKTRAPQTVVVAPAVAALVALAIFSAREAGWRQAVLACVGFFAGLALYHSSFGFAFAWRRMLIDRRGRAIRAQLVMLALAIVVFFPALAQGSLFGADVSGFVNPVGLALVVGSFLFGVGMQLAGGCGSGTLYTAGGGNTRMIVALAAFVAGSLAATADPLRWRSWPDIGAWSLVETLGGTWSLVVGLLALAVCYAAALAIERIRHGAAEPLGLDIARSSLVAGPWPLVGGAVALALVNVATLALAGRPWGITYGFALWGAKIAAAIGVDVAAWPFWQGESALAANLFADSTSVMNFGLMLGAAAAAGLAGAYAPQARIPLPSLAAAALGGLLMGVGARLATGCNIGAFFSGLASGSAHGLVWALCAFAGVALGARLRPLFGLSR